MLAYEKGSWTAIAYCSVIVSIPDQSLRDSGALQLLETILKEH